MEFRRVLFRSGWPSRALTNVMLTIWLGAIFKPKAAVLLVLLGLCGPALAQEVSFALLQPASIEPNPMVRSVEPVTLPEAAPTHRFWDRENSILFATNAA